MIEYKLKKMSSWSDVNADLVITDPPFGIEFDGKENNYNRDESNVVDGYVEWSVKEYKEKIKTLLSVIYSNTKPNGQCLIFSGWNNSHIIHKEIVKSSLTLQGKMYWEYNFAPYCKKRPAHNVYEIFWATKNDSWVYNNECSYEHCKRGEANLSAMQINRDYHKDMPKYPTRLPSEVVGVLLEHYSNKDDVIFDPLAGSGMVGIVSEEKDRNAILGDLNNDAYDVFKEIQAKRNVGSRSLFDY